VARDPDNAHVATQLEELAALLDLAETTPFAARAYRRAATTIRDTPLPVARLVREGRERELRGIGPGISARLRETDMCHIVIRIDIFLSFLVE
jgi:DNA polymerase (family 10)